MRLVFLSSLLYPRTLTRASVQCLSILPSLLCPPAAHFLPWMIDVGKKQNKKQLPLLWGYTLITVFWF